MEKSLKNTSLTTKFLCVLIVNILFLIVDVFIEYPLNSVRPAIFNIEVSIVMWICGILLYSLFAAKIWQMLEQNDVSTNKERLGKIALACIFATIICAISEGDLSKETVMEHYICTPIEIILVFLFEKIFICLGNKENIVRKIAHFCESAIMFYIYAIVVACFLTWIPSLNWDFLPFKILWHIVGPYMVLFDEFVPPIVGINFSPVLAVTILVFVKKRFGIYFANILDKFEENKVEEETSDTEENKVEEPECNNEGNE